MTLHYDGAVAESEVRMRRQGYEPRPNYITTLQTLQRAH